MHKIDEIAKSYPDWYNVEREAEKTIKKLTNMKELNFYLTNSNEYVRRLAIIRVDELCLRDGINELSEIMNDGIESPLNKDLAAWAIKSISYKLDIDLFISSRHLSKYSGQEKLEEIFEVDVDEVLPALKLASAVSTLNSEMQLQMDSINRNQDINFEITFTFREWLKVWLKEFQNAFIKLLAGIPHAAWRFVKQVPRFIYNNILIKSGHKLAFLFSRSKPEKQWQAVEPRRIQSKTYSSSNIHVPDPSMIIKNLVFYSLYITFFPARLIIRHKLIAFFIFGAFYFTLSSTEYGRALVFNYLGLDLKHFHGGVYNASKAVLLFVSGELKVIMDRLLSFGGWYL